MATEVQPQVDPAPEQSHSGRLMLRMPPSLHAELARAAEEEGVSLNTFILGVLAASVGWRAPEAGDGSPQLPHWARRTLLVNLVVMALLAVAAAVLVAVALLNG